MGNVNEGHERDEALSSSSDSADDLSESPSSLSYDERDGDERSGVDPSDEMGDLSILSDTLSVNEGLDEIMAESTRVEQAIELDLSQYREVGVDTTTLVEEQGMTSLISNLSLPISESIIPSSFELLGEVSPFAEGDEVFHTPDLSAESNEEISAQAKQFQILIGFNDSLALVSRLVEEEHVSGHQGKLPKTEENDLQSINEVLPDITSAGQSGNLESDPQQVSEEKLGVSALHVSDEGVPAEGSSSELLMPSALSILDSILGNQGPLPTNDDGFNEVRTSIVINDAANEIMAKFDNADFVLTRPNVPDPSLSARATECDKCGHVLNNVQKSTMQPEQSEGRPANDRTDKEFKALEDALLLSAADNPVVDLIANDSLPKNVQHIDEAGKSEGPVKCPISVSDSLGEMDGNLSDHNTLLVASSGDAVMHPEELTQNVESRRNEPECEPLLPLENPLRISMSIHN